jgi:hypothetical protein
MTTPDEDEPAGRPLRRAAVALLIVAVVALIIGAIALSQGGGGGTATPSGTTVPAPTGATTGTAGTGTTAAPGPTGATTPATTTPATPPGGTTTPAPGGQPGTPGQPGQPGGGQPGGGQPGGGQPGGDGGVAALKATPVRVYNNSTITGLANTAADDFRTAGWNVEVVGNYPFGVVPTSTAYYRPGTAEQPAAQELAGEFGMRSDVRFAGIQDSSPGLIVIVTNDFKGAKDP